MRNIAIPANYRSFFNLTPHTALNNHTLILSLGLKHIPIPQDVSDSTIRAAFERCKNTVLWSIFHRRLPDPDYNPDEDADPFNLSLYRKAPRTSTTCNSVSKSHSVHKHLHAFHKAIEAYIISNPTKFKHSPEATIYREIKSKYPDVIFKPADKNLGLVALPISTYNDLVMEHLSNSSNYSLQTEHVFAERALFDQVGYNYRAFLNQQNNYSFCFKPQEKKFLGKWDTKNFKIPPFYILPKLHKAGPLKGRPISGAINWFTTPLSIILNERLKDVLYRFPNILKNSEKLVTDLEYGNIADIVDKDFYFITGDVDSLYPNIKQVDLIKIITDLTLELGSLTEFILTNAYTYYNGKAYKQREGIPMGTNSAVNLANIYMGTKVDRYISSRKEVLYYTRYIDDLFIIWTGSLDTWKLVESNINRLDSKLHIVFEPPSKTRAIFLDLDITRNPFTNLIQTTVYQKKLNKYLYITPKSSHFNPTFSGFIKGELTRYARLSTSPLGYNATKELFQLRLRNRGYSMKCINTIFKEHEWISRFYPKPIRSPILPFIIPYTYRANQSELKQAFEHYGEIFSIWGTPNPLFVYSATANMSNFLVESSITPHHRRCIQRQQQTKAAPLLLINNSKF